MTRDCFEQGKKYHHSAREDRKKAFAEIWEEEQSKYQNQKKDELKKNKGLVKLGKPTTT